MFSHGNLVMFSHGMSRAEFKKNQRKGMSEDEMKEYKEDGRIRAAKSRALRKEMNSSGNLGALVQAFSMVPFPSIDTDIASVPLHNDTDAMSVTMKRDDDVLPASAPARKGRVIVVTRVDIAYKSIRKSTGSYHTRTLLLTFTNISSLNVWWHL